MHFFSDDYLMHYGVKGMKWRKKKSGIEDDRPGDRGRGGIAGVHPDEQDNLTIYNHYPSEAEKKMAKRRVERLNREARIRNTKRNAARHYKEDVGRSLQRAKKSRGFSATDERKGTASYVHATHDDVGGSKHLKYYKRKDGSYAPHR